MRRFAAISSTRCIAFKRFGPKPKAVALTLVLLGVVGALSGCSSPSTHTPSEAEKANFNGRQPTAEELRIAQESIKKSQDANARNDPTNNSNSPAR